MLTLRELNRTLLARQMLLRRQKLPIPRAVERLGAVQAQWSPSPYIALWSRLEGLRIEQLERALARGSVVKATLMRATLHMVSREDYWAFAEALGCVRLERVRRRFPALDVDAVVQELYAVAAEGPIDRQVFYDTLRAAAGTKVKPDELWPLWATLLLQAELVHELPSGAYGFYRSASLAPASVRLGARPALPPDPVAHLVSRYLAAFGPASREDIGSWTGLQPSELRPALESLSPRTFRDENGRLLFDLPRGPFVSGDTPAPVRFLPKWDSSLLAYSPPERVRILPERYRKTVIRKNGDVLPTFLVDGFVAGSWSVEKRKVKLDPFEKLSGEAQRALAEEGERLVAFLPQ